MIELKTLCYRLSGGVMVVSAGLIALFFIGLRDYSYAVIAAPISFVGIVSWCIAGLIEWRHWFAVPLAIFALPFLPWVDGIYG